MKKIETNGKTVLFVEVPEGSKDIYIENDNLYLTSRFMEYKDIITYSELPVGSWQILGKSNELSEEQMKEICERGIIGFVDYKMKGFSNFESAKQSYLSLLEANGICDRNPYGESEPLISDPDLHSQYYGSQLDELSRWQEAQSKVKHYLVLIKN